MTNIDSSDDESDVYYDSSDDDNSYLYIGDQIIEQTTPYCACCNILIDNNISYLHCSNTNDYLCLRCFESAHINDQTADDYNPIYGQ